MLIQDGQQRPYRHMIGWDSDLVNQAVDSARSNNQSETVKPTLLILGGEPTVVIRGSGRGGRNQQLAMELRNIFHQSNESIPVVFMSCGTDGQDGPCPVAGAVFDFEEPIKDGFLKAINEESF